MITDCHLNLRPALARCESAYGYRLKCEQVVYGKEKDHRAPFVTAKCPGGYQRYGCCKCLRKCNYSSSIMADAAAGEDPKDEEVWTKTTYCLKRHIVRSKILALKDEKGVEKQMVGLELNNYSIVEKRKNKFMYVQNCPKNYMRKGIRYCLAVCPLGWYDFVDRCEKRGELIFFPFVWQPGDGKVTPKQKYLKEEIQSKRE